ncbi:MAG: hypothetical protein JWP20_2513, partial [Roseomonas sp.]|nr:hypothetical protein [Roseomonas sp.]
GSRVPPPPEQADGEGLGAVRRDADALKGNIAAGARQTGSELQDEASNVMSGMKDMGAELAGVARLKAAGLAEQGKEAGAERAEGLANAVRRVADDLEDSSPEIAKHVRSAADSVESVASSLRQRSAGDLLNDVNDFARRQPAAFFGVAVLAGFAVSRFAKSSAPGRAGHGQGDHDLRHGGAPSGLAGNAPGWVPPSAGPSGVARPATMSAATLGGAVAHRPGSAGPGSMPNIEEVTS